MSLKHALCLVTILLFSSGCSVYPLPQDTTGLVTSEIVSNIRCEARDGLRQTAIEQFRSVFPNDRVYKNFTGSEFADILTQNPAMFEEVFVRDLNPKAYEAFKYYEQSQIAYAFSLDLMESNLDDFSVGVTRVLPSRRDTIGIGATATRTRNVKRDFNIVDTFGELAALKDSYCRSGKTVNIIYPMTGKLPIADLISSYIHTNQFDNLGGPNDNIAGTATTPAISRMGDTIIFDTKVQGSFNPGSILNPTAGLFSLTSIGFGTTDYRSDRHQVIIVVSTSADSAKLRRLDAKLARPGLDLVALPPAVRLNKTEDRVLFGIETTRAQRERNVQDAIIQIGNSLSRLNP